MAGYGKERPDNTLTLFKNDDRRNERDPVYKGQGTIDGREYWVSGWVNESRKDGRKYLSVKVKPKQETRRDNYERRDARREQAPLDDFDSEIPF